jgi:lyso-ornithine lipid O-acyltransferase
MGSVEKMGSSLLRLWRLALYLGWTVPLMPVQAIGLAFRRPWVATLPRFYHRQCCRLLGLRVRVVGHPTIRRPVLFAANHISYLDIPVFGAVLPASFIAKSEIAGWPLFGWLARLQRSIFIDRRMRSTIRQRDNIAGRLAAGDALILFPEGTSGNGNRILPFKSALFGVADAVPEVAVQPVSIAYTRLDDLPIGRPLRPFFAWYGAMTLAPHLWRVLGLGTIEVVVEFHPSTTLAECGSRKALARYCEASVAAGMADALSGRRGLPAAPPTSPLPAPAAAEPAPTPAFG